MSLVPDEHFSPRLSFNFAPMVDFLFIVIAIFAVVAITRKALYDADVNLVQHDAPNVKSTSNNASNTVNLSISALGEYKWLDLSEEQTFKTIQSVKEALLQQMGDPAHSQILLHIDQNAQWTPIAKLIFAMHEEGFTVYPVYEKKESKPFIMKN